MSYCVVSCAKMKKKTHTNRKTQETHTHTQNCLKAKARYQAAEDKVESLMAEKEDEVNKLSNKLNSLQVDRDSQSQRLRQEFDQKLTDYISKREEQYKEEKNEWMRIFKEEFNRKLRTYKENNYDLEHSNQKLNTELTDVKNRNAKLRTQKTELESQNRQLVNTQN